MESSPSVTAMFSIQARSKEDLLAALQVLETHIRRDDNDVLVLNDTNAQFYGLGTVRYVDEFKKLF